MMVGGGRLYRFGRDLWNWNDGSDAFEREVQQGVVGRG